MTQATAMFRMPLWGAKPPAGSPEDDFRPWLEVYLVDTGVPRGAVLICPGGGYMMRAPHEAAPIAQCYNAAGFHAFVVHYRVAPHRHPAPLLDASRALRLIRYHATGWQVDPAHIAVCGFSAGGHLAGSLGVHFDLPILNRGDALDEVDSRPDALILCYPVISSSQVCGHRGSFTNLLGPTPDPELLALMSLENQVTPQTPPTFLWHTADDQVVPVQNSLVFVEALARQRVPFELHIYPHGPHGLGLAETDPHIATWSALSIEWLRGMNW